MIARKKLYTFKLPEPPSANRLWRRGRGGHLFVNQEYKRWLNIARDLLPALKIESAVEVEIFVDTRKDIDNVIKPILDALEEAKTILSDRQVVAVRAVRGGERERVSVLMWVCL